MNDAMLFGRQVPLFQITWCQIPQDRNQKKKKKCIGGHKNKTYHL
jgi:hypothetical protein